MRKSPLSLATGWVRTRCSKNVLDLNKKLNPPSKCLTGEKSPLASNLSRDLKPDKELRSGGSCERW